MKTNIFISRYIQTRKKKQHYNLYEVIDKYI